MGWSTVAVIVCLTCARLPAAAPPTALELMDRYKAHQDRLQSSFRITCQTSYQVFVQEGRVERNYTALHDLRYDGTRVSMRRYTWGHTMTGQHVSKDKPWYNSSLWDGSPSIVTYHGAGDDAGRVLISNDKDAEYKQRYARSKLSRGYAGVTLLGYFLGSDERIDEVARNAKHLKVRNRRERVGGSDCYIIDVVGDTGKYTLWLDPDHGYNIAKATSRVSTGDLFYGKIVPVVLQPGRAPSVTAASVSLKNVRFQKVDDVWVPVEADVVRSVKGDHFNAHVDKHHYKVMEVMLKPDHDALGSFVPDDIRDGAAVQYTDALDVKYVWRHGAVENTSGQSVGTKAEEQETRVSLPIVLEPCR